VFLSFLHFVLGERWTEKNWVGGNPGKSYYI
jgi:hypothetical protein